MSGTAGLEGEAECIVSNRLTAVVWNTAHITRLAEAARAAGVEEPVRVHLEVDSGMSRQGVAPGRELDAVLKAIAGEPRVTLDGVFTPFASTEIAGSEQTAAQQRSFEAAVEHVVAAALRAEVGACGELFLYRQCKGEHRQRRLKFAEVAARGYAACRRGGHGAERSGSLRICVADRGAGNASCGAEGTAVMTWKTRVIGLQEIPVGALVGYNGTFAAQAPMRLALLPVGYADGLRRELSYGNMKTGNANVGGWVVIRGERAPIVGRVSMNLTTVDVSGIAGVDEGDEVVLLGDGVSANDHARIAGTIAYEIVCGVKTAE
jgi:alanine racemase